MGSQVPYWIQVLSALAVPAIALLALVVGVAQWRTAQQRAVLDVFDKRWEVHTKIREVLSKVFRDGTVNDDTLRSFLRATDGASFLFGSKVNVYLGLLYDALAHHQAAEEEMKNPSSEEARLKAIKSKSEHFLKIADSFTKLPKLLDPYLRMHQRVPPV